MNDKKPTQAMPDDGLEGAPDGTDEPLKMDIGESAASGAGGGPYPRPCAKKPKKPEFRGGQTNAAYHGTGQLGEQRVGDGENPNSTAQED